MDDRRFVPDDVDPEPIVFNPPDEDFAPSFALRRGEYENEGRRFAVMAAAPREHGHELDEEYLSQVKVWARAITDQELKELEQLIGDGDEPNEKGSDRSDFADVIAAIEQESGDPDEIAFALQIRSVGAETAAMWVIDPPIKDGRKHAYPGGSSVRVSIDRSQYPNGRVTVIRPGKPNLVVPPTDTFGAKNGCVVKGNAVGGAVWSCYHIQGAGKMESSS
jgi:hypothetical protein